MTLFGGYHAYRATPAHVALRHRLRILAKWQAEAEANEEIKDQLETQRQQYGSR